MKIVCPECGEKMRIKDLRLLAISSKKLSKISCNSCNHHLFAPIAMVVRAVGVLSLIFAYPIILCAQYYRETGYAGNWMLLVSLTSIAFMVVMLVLYKLGFVLAWHIYLKKRKKSK